MTMCIRLFFMMLFCLAVSLAPASANDYNAPDNAPVPRAKPVQFAQNMIGGLQTIVTKHEDTFSSLAREHNLGFVELVIANPDLDPWLPGEGRKVTLPTQYILPDASRRGIVINLPEMRLYYYKNDGSTPDTYPIGIGREGLETPTGTTYVSWKKEGPTWRPTPRMREEDPELPEEVGPGPENPLGTHALYLGWPTYMIHGTDKPWGIGRRVSSGCIRLYPDDIVEVFSKTEGGVTVTVVDQPIKLAWIDDKLYMEAHTTMDQANTFERDGINEFGAILPPFEMPKDMTRKLLSMVEGHANWIDWGAVRDVIRERRGYPIVIATKKENS